MITVFAGSDCDGDEISHLFHNIFCLIHALHRRLREWLSIRQTISMAKCVPNSTYPVRHGIPQSSVFTEYLNKSFSFLFARCLSFMLSIKECIIVAIGISYRAVEIVHCCISSWILSVFRCFVHTNHLITKRIFRSVSFPNVLSLLRCAQTHEILLPATACSILFMFVGIVKDQNKWREMNRKYFIFLKPFGAVCVEKWRKYVKFIKKRMVICRAVDCDSEHGH